MNIESFARGLRELGVEGTVEARGAMIVVAVRDVARAADPRVRANALALASRHGFTHLALELADDDGDASFSRD